MLGWLLSSKHHLLEFFFFNLEVYICSVWIVEIVLLNSWLIIVVYISLKGSLFKALEYSFTFFLYIVNVSLFCILNFHHWHCFLSCKLLFIDRFQELKSYFFNLTLIFFICFPFIHVIWGLFRLMPSNAEFFFLKYIWAYLHFWVHLIYAGPTVFS